MEFLGIGPLELLVILILVMIIFSPKDLAQAGRTMGRFLNQLNRSETWRSMKQVSMEMQDLPTRLAREAQLEDLKELQKGIELDPNSPYKRLSPADPVPSASDLKTETLPPADAAPEANPPPADSK
jgi:Sec-independent protein translocase protein TatA